MKGSIPSETDKILAVLFVEFDNNYGIKLSYQVPENFIAEARFKVLENYFVTKSKQLHGKLIVTQMFNFQTIGIPTEIPHSNAVQNGRKVSIFNIVIVTKLGANTDPYEKILKKLISYFTIFEQEKQFLSSDGKNTRILGIINSIFHGINDHGYCCVNVIDELNVIKLSYVNKDHCVNPPQIKDSDVPIIISNLEESAAWDLTLRELYPFLDNQKPVRLLADLSLLDLVLVKKCIQSLIYYNLAFVVSPIRYSNTYYVTSAIQSIMQDPALQDECIEYIKMDERYPSPSWEVIFNLYETFQSGIKLKQVFLYEKPFMRNVNERRLVEFGLLKGILKRLHKYPVASNGTITGSNVTPELQEYIQHQVLDGQHSYDDICIKLNLKLEKVENDLDFCKNITIIQKLDV
ncbi:hypothetical protein ACHWQZ_G009512 [Mnemiopsis leidyi]